MIFLFRFPLMRLLKYQKKYSTEDSSKFINGILGGFVRTGILDK